VRVCVCVCVSVCVLCVSVCVQVYLAVPFGKAASSYTKCDGPLSEQRVKQKRWNYGEMWDKWSTYNNKVVAWTDVHEVCCQSYSDSHCFSGELYKGQNRLVHGQDQGHEQKISVLPPARSRAFINPLRV
jgi:hypothetical protein